jgi:integrase
VFGSTPLADLRRQDVERLVHELVDAGRSQSTVAGVLRVVRAVLARALDEGSIPRNVASQVEATGRAAKERAALSGADLAKLRSYVVGDRRGACWLLSLCGLRRSEVLGLTWQDVDLSAGTITIDHAVVADARTAKRCAPSPPKTRRGYRVLPLPPDVLTELRGLRDAQAAEHGFEQARTGWLVIDERAEPYRPERWSDEWRQLCRAAGVPPVSLHAARHSSVTAMRDRGVADHLVAAWHGHDEVVMRRTYSHADADGLAAAGRALADVLGGKAAVPMA